MVVGHRAAARSGAMQTRSTVPPSCSSIAVTRSSRRLRSGAAIGMVAVGLARARRMAG
jgi:hypothetical protein